MFTGMKQSRMSHVIVSVLFVFQKRKFCFVFVNRLYNVKYVKGNIYKKLDFTYKRLKIVGKLYCVNPVKIQYRLVQSSFSPKT